MPTGPAELAFLTDALRLIVQIYSTLSGNVRIAESFDDRQDDETRCPSEPRPAATSLSVAAVDDGADYRDSGQRYFFLLENGVAKVRKAGDSRWDVIAPDGQGQTAISYHDRTEGQQSTQVAFDMIAAGAGRILVKERDVARFYFTMMDPNFLFHGSERINSTYFKLYPRMGQPSAGHRQRLAHLDGANIAHPAATRFPIFRLLFSLDQVDNMAVNVDRHRKVWHRIDLRAPEDGVDPPAGLSHVPPSVKLVRYTYADGSSKTKKGIPMYRVLDLGVGHEHWHEQESAIYGGEMDSLDGPGLPPALEERNVYRFFNGPIDDKGGFVDGTANHYVLAQLVPDGALTGGPRPDAYGILWMDEQAVFSERWRLLHPDDCRFGGFRETVPSALVQYLSRVPRYYQFAFDRRKFFCPCRAMHVGAESRMAVSRQVIVVNGYDPQSRRHLLYSINFSFGTCDRTWRWRELPPLHAITGGRREDVDKGRVPFERFGLREDMTLHVVQRHLARRFVWYQRYLPADHRHRPDGQSLRLPNSQLIQKGTPALAAMIRQLTSPAGEPDEVPNAPMPREGFDHPWQFLPAEVWDTIHERYSHFGCFQDEVNWRCQYYLVDVDPAQVPDGTLDGERLSDGSGALSIRQLCLDWRELNDAIATAGDLTAPLVAWAREIERRLSQLDAALDEIRARLAALRIQLDRAWDQATGRLQDLLERIGSSGRSGARSRVKSAVIDKALDVLRAIPLYESAPAEVREFARDRLRSVIQDVLDNDLFDGLWRVVARVAQETAALMDDVKQVDPAANLTSQLKDLILDRLEAAVRDHFGGDNPRIELSFRVTFDLGQIHFDDRFDLGRFNIPLGQIRGAVREAVRDLEMFEDRVRQLADEVKDAFDKAAARARAELERADLLKALDELISTASLREQLVSLMDRMIDNGLFVRSVHRRSLFHDKFFLKLLHRPPLGYLLVHWDKRDDDLLPFNELTPNATASIAIALKRQDGRRIPAVIRGWRPVVSPPAVHEAEIRVQRNSAGQPAKLIVRFRPAATGAPLAENIWRIRIAGLPVAAGTFGPAEVFFDVLRHEKFQPDGQSGFHNYIWNLASEPAHVRERVSRYCSEEGRQRHGTSLWFENVVGQVNTPDKLKFA